MQENNHIYKRLISDSLLLDIPLVAQLELTNKCNLRCIHCVNCNRDKPYVTRKPELTYGLIKKILNQLYDLKTFFLIITGGEPLVKENFFRILGYVCRKQFVVEIFTNGTMLTAENISKLTDLNVFKLSITLYGMTETVHDGITQVKGSFHKTMAGIERAHKHAMDIMLKSPLMKQNFTEIKKLAVFAKKSGLKILFNPLISDRFDRDGEISSYRLLDGQLLEFRKTEAQKYTNAAGGTHNFLEHCSAGKYFIWINSFGQVSACMGMPFIGDAGKKNIRNIWKSKKMKEISRLSLDDLTHCKKCAYVKHCKICPAMAYHQNGSITGRWTEICRNTKLGR